MRPRVHFTPRAGWVNDPLALTWRGDHYEMFFQYVPRQTEWAHTCRWGHAASPDGLTWTELDVVLSPGDGDAGCWSGSVVQPTGELATLFYTAVDDDNWWRGRIRVAHAADEGWNIWVKGDVVAELPADITLRDYRDPWVVRDGDIWRMVVGAGTTDGVAVALGYSSPDLAGWTYDGVLASRAKSETDPIYTGDVWECPQLFEVDGRWVLTFSAWEPMNPLFEGYAIGSLVEGRFVPDAWGRLSYGPSYYAGSAFTHVDGTRGLIYWLRNISGAGWAGAHSLPHVLSLAGDRLVAAPPPALTARRVNSSPFGPAPSEISLISDIEWDGTGTLTLAGPGTRIECAATDGELSMTAGDDTWRMPASGAVRVVVDGPVLELFSAAGVFALPVPGGITSASVAAGTATAHQLLG